MTDAELKRGLRQFLKKKPKSRREVEIYAAEALHKIKSLEKKVEFLEGVVKSYEKADREKMIGQLNV